MIAVAGWMGPPARAMAGADVQVRSSPSHLIYSSYRRFLVPNFVHRNATSDKLTVFAVPAINHVSAVDVDQITKRLRGAQKTTSFVVLPTDALTISSHTGREHLHNEHTDAVSFTLELGGVRMVPHGHIWSRIFLGRSLCDVHSHTRTAAPS